MAPLTGLTALAGYQTTDVSQQATAEQRLGRPANPIHGYPGEQARPYPWQSNSTQAGSAPMAPTGVENQILGDDEWFWEAAGYPNQDPTMDQTPSRRAAPWPKGIASGPVPGERPDDIAHQLVQSREIHNAGHEFNVARRAELGFGPLNDQWDSFENDDAGHTDLTTLPRQSMSSGFMWGTRDRTQSFARQNLFGFDGHHKFRRWATGSIPGNTMWMRPGGRPLRKTLAGPARPAVGPTSPFYGNDLGKAFSIDGAMLQNVPQEYTPPPTPNLAAAPKVVYTGDDSEVSWW